MTLLCICISHNDSHIATNNDIDYAKFSIKHRTIISKQDLRAIKCTAANPSKAYTLALQSTVQGSYVLTECNVKVKFSHTRY